MRSSLSSSAPTLTTTAIFPLATNGATIDLTSLPGAHSTTMSATSTSASIGRTAGGFVKPASQPRCFSGFCADTATRARPAIPWSSACATFLPIAPSPTIATRRSGAGPVDELAMDWLLYALTMYRDDGATVSARRIVTTLAPGESLLDHELAGLAVIAFDESLA